MSLVFIFIYLSFVIPLVYVVNHVLGLYNNEMSFTEISTVFLYFVAMVVNIYKSKQAKMPLHFIVFASLVVFTFIQRELNLVRQLTSAAASLEFYKQYGKFLHCFYILPALFLFAKNMKFYIKTYDAKLYLVAGLFVLIVLISQTCNTFRFSSPFWLTIEEAFEMTIPLSIWFVLQEFVAVKVRKNDEKMVK